MSTNAKTNYQNLFSIHSDSGTGVLLTRAREPFRVIAALREHAMLSTSGSEFKVWNIIGGWHSYDHAKPEAQPLRDKKINPQAAVKAIGDLDGDGTNVWASGIYVMDGLHPFLGGASDKPDPIIVATLRQYAYALATNQTRLVIVVPESFVLPSELQHDIPVVDYDLPDREELSLVLTEVIESSFGDDTASSEMFTAAECEQLVSSACGMTRLEAESAFAQGVVRNMASFPNISFDDFNKVVLKTKTDVVKRSEVLELMSTGRLEDVGGLDQLKAWVAMRRKCFTQEARDFGADTPKGIALIGPPGTGKSISAKAIAASLGQPLIRFDVSKVFGGIIGQTEGRVAAALKQLAAMAPCVAFIDEIDKAGLDPRGGSGDGGVSKRVIGNILTFMSESPAPIFWLFTANRVDGLPPEILRKGRLDEVFAVLPPNASERRQVLDIHLKARKQDPSKLEGLDVAVAESEGYVSAELEAAVKEAVIQAFNSGEPVTGEAISEQLRNMKPMSVAFADDFNAMKEWASNNARLASTPEKPMEGKTMLPGSGAVAEGRPRRRSLRIGN